MTILSARRSLVLAKLETTEGTAIATAAVDAVLVSNLTLTPITGGTADRELVQPYYGNSPQIPINTHQQVEFQTEIAGAALKDVSSAPIIAPEWGKLLQCVGFDTGTFSKYDIGSTGDQAPSQNNLLTYKPISGSEKSLTIRANLAGQQHTLAGAKGNVVFRIASGEIPRMQWRFLGRWAEPGSVLAIEPNYSAWQPPLPASNVNTPEVSFFGEDAIRVSSIEIDMGIEVLHREIIGADSAVVITDRAVSGTIVMDAIALSTWNPFAAALAGTTGALEVVQGKAGPADGSKSGGQVRIKCPKCQLGEPTYGEADGVRQINLPFVALPNAAAGNDEITVEVL